MTAVAVEPISESTEEVKPFDFDSEFQTKIAALALRDDEFVRRTSHILKPEYFENAGEAKLVELALKHFQKYNCVPDKASLVKAIKDAVISKAISKEVAPLVVEARKQIIEADISNRSFVEDHVVNFARQQGMAGAIIKSLELLRRGNFTKIEELIAEATSIGINEDGSGYDYYSKVSDRTVLRIEKETGVLPPQGITTGDPKLDSVLYHRGWGRKELTSIMGGAKAGKCVVRDTLIFTEDGLSEIGDYVPQDLGVDQFKDHVMGILGKDGMELTSHVYNSGLNPTIKIVTRKGYDVEGTYHHPMLVMNAQGQHEWKRLDEIKVGDFMVGQRNQQVYGSKVDLSYAVNVATERYKAIARKSQAHSVTLPSTMTPELAEWLGMFIAEGYCGEKANMTFTQKDDGILNRFVDLSKTLFGLDFKVKPSESSKTPTVSASSVVVQTYLEALGVRWVTSKDKVVPSAILRADRASVLAFLSALIGLEGHVRRASNAKTAFDLCMASEKLIKQVKMLLLNEGIVCSYSVKQSKATNGLNIDRDYYRLQVSGASNLRNLIGIGVYEERKNKALNVDCKPATERDWIPNTRNLIGRIMKEIQDSGHSLKSKLDSSFYRQLRTLRSGRANEVRHLTYSFAEKLLSELDRLEVVGAATDELRARLDENYFYDEVKAIEYGEAETVDLTVPKTHSFFANGLISHNTTALINFARAASWAGHNVLYVTLEVGANIIADRLDASVSGTYMKELGSKAASVAEAVKKIGEKAGKIIFQEYASGTCTPNMLRQCIQRYKNPGRNPDGSMRPPIKFDLIVVDYADIMAPNYRTQDAIENSKSVYVDLRAIAFEENVAVLTATQTNREGYKSAVAKAEHVSEDFNKVRTVDLMISINKTEEEAARGEARLYFAASRNQESGFTIVIKQNLAMMRFIEEVIRIE